VPWPVSALSNQLRRLSGQPCPVSGQSSVLTPDPQLHRLYSQPWPDSQVTHLTPDTCPPAACCCCSGEQHPEPGKAPFNTLIMITDAGEINLQYR
jgi:hypothetical protein